MNPTPVQDSAPDLHLFVTLANTLQPDWRLQPNHSGYEWVSTGVFHCLAVPDDEFWLAQVSVEGPAGTQTWRRASLPSRQSAQSFAEVALTHLLRLQDASEFWRATL